MRNSGRPRLVALDELRRQYRMQRPDLRASGAVLKPAEGVCRGQIVVASDGRLHQHISAKHLMIVEVFIAAAQTEQPLSQKITHAVADPLGVARIGYGQGRSAAQTHAGIDLTQEHQAAIAAEFTAPEVCLKNAPAHASEIDLLVRTLWHRQSSVFIDVRYL
jgi:hypothetical protein